MQLSRLVKQDLLPGMVNSNLETILDTELLNTLARLITRSGRSQTYAPHLVHGGSAQTAKVESKATQG